MRADCYGVMSDQVEQYWYLFEPYISSALRHGDGLLTTDAVLAAIKDREMQLWVVGGSTILGVGVTQITNHPGGKVLTIVTLAGKLFRHWCDGAFGVMLEYAKANSCTKIQVNGRKGWERLLSGNWHVTHRFTMEVQP